jgi:hypothetical protein
VKPPKSRRAASAPPYVVDERDRVGQDAGRALVAADGVGAGGDVAGVHQGGAALARRAPELVALADLGAWVVDRFCSKEVTRTKVQTIGEAPR